MKTSSEKKMEALEKKVEELSNEVYNIRLTIRQLTKSVKYANRS